MLFLIVIQIKGGHVMAEVSNASAPFPVREALWAFLSGDMSLREASHCCVSLASWATTSIAQYAMERPWQLLYDLWLIADLRELWHTRPWAKHHKVEQKSAECFACIVRKSDNDN
jgi:hypothetical protein